MKDAQKPDHVSLNTLVNYLRDGRFVIPDFQREFEWKPRDIRELMRSIFLDYYIGSLLLWKGKSENFAALSCEPVYGYQGAGKPEYIVLDGQQRLTAIYYAFLAPDVPLPNKANRFFYHTHLSAGERRQRHCCRRSASDAGCNGREIGSRKTVANHDLSIVTNSTSWRLRLTH